MPPEGIPSVDLIACNISGDNTVMIQVKTTEWASRNRGRGDNKAPHHLEFPLGKHAGNKQSKKLFYAFVDLKGWQCKENQPDVYLIPSSEVFAYYKDWAETAKMVRFHRSLDYMHKYKNNWEIIFEELGKSAHGSK